MDAILFAIRIPFTPHVWHFFPPWITQPALWRNELCTCHLFRNSHDLCSNVTSWVGVRNATFFSINASISWLILPKCFWPQQSDLPSSGPNDTWMMFSQSFPWPQVFNCSIYLQVAIQQTCDYFFCQVFFLGCFLKISLQRSLWVTWRCAMLCKKRRPVAFQAKEKVSKEKGRKRPQFQPRASWRFARFPV